MLSWGKKNKKSLLKDDVIAEADVIEETDRFNSLSELGNLLTSLEQEDLAPEVQTFAEKLGSSQISSKGIRTFLESRLLRKPIAEDKKTNLEYEKILDLLTQALKNTQNENEYKKIRKNISRVGNFFETEMLFHRIGIIDAIPFKNFKSKEDISPLSKIEFIDVENFSNLKKFCKLNTDITLFSDEERYKPAQIEIKKHQAEIAAFQKLKSKAGMALKIPLPEISNLNNKKASGAPELLPGFELQRAINPTAYMKVDEPASKKKENLKKRG